jgi:CBS domain containing-hemolysin-like protein
MTLFIVSVLVVLLVSAICSLSEAAMYAVRLPYVRQIAGAGSRAGLALSGFKENMERPISAILIVNTAANTAGAAVAGAQARVLFGEASLLWFSLCFTLGVLFLSEIIPKVLGVVYSRPVATALALPWVGMIRLLYPVIWVIQQSSRLLKPRQSLAAPEEEVHQFAMLSAEEGSIMPREAEMVSNVLRLDEVKTRDIMTPRPVVFKLASNMTLREVSKKVKQWTHTRVPVYDAGDPEAWKGFVFSRDVLTGLANDQFETTLESLCHPLFFVSETTAGHVLLRSFLKRRTHLVGVVDEYGDITGIVTLEDVLESVLGEEIVDEADSAVDMQEVAKQRKRDHFKKTDADGLIVQENDDRETT